MKPLIIIPARFESTRFPGKPLVDINGKSMIMHVVDKALTFCKDVYVATDDERIYNHVRGFGANAIMTSREHPSGTDRINEAFTKIQGNHNFNVVVNLQGDEPFIEPKQIEELTEVFKNPEVQIATLAKLIDDKKEITDSNKVKVIFDINGRSLYFSRSIIPFNRDDYNGMYYRHVGIYAFKPEILKQICLLPQCELEKTEKLEQLRWLWNGYNIHVSVTKYETFSVDRPEDLKSIV